MHLAMRQTKFFRNARDIPSNIYYKNPPQSYLAIYRYAAHLIKRIDKCVIFYAVIPPKNKNLMERNGKVAI